VVDGLSAFIDHMKQVHNSSTGLVCPICEKDRFVRREQLRFHIQVHNELKRPCEVSTTFIKHTKELLIMPVINALFFLL
jgi:ribosomal protein L36